MSSDPNNTNGSDSDINQVLGAEQVSHKRRKIRRWLFIGLLVIIGAFVFVRSLYNDEGLTQTYKTVQLSRGDLTVTVTATGNLQPVTQVQVGSEVSGTIKTVNVDYNDRINKGQVLAQIDTSQLEAKVKQSKAALSLASAGVREAEATVKETHAKLIRSQELRKSGMCSQEECDAAEAVYARAEAALQRAKAQVVEARAALDANRSSLDKATIRSPINGIVLQRNVEPGQTVAASFQTPVLFTLAENLSQMELHVAIDEADVGQVVKGLAAHFSVDAYPKRQFPARIRDVHFAPQTVEGVVTYETLLSVDNSNLILRPGMTATAEIVVNVIKDALLVPNAALRFKPPQKIKQESSGGLVGAILPRRPRQPKESRSTESSNDQRLWIVVNGQLQAIPVTIGASDGIHTEIVDGEIGADTKVVIDVIN